MEENAEKYAWFHDASQLILTENFRCFRRRRCAGMEGKQEPRSLNLYLQA